MKRTLLTTFVLVLAATLPLLAADDPAAEGRELPLEAQSAASPPTTLAVGDQGFEAGESPVGLRAFAPFAEVLLQATPRGQGASAPCGMEENWYYLCHPQETCPNGDRCARRCDWATHQCCWQPECVPQETMCFE